MRIEKARQNKISLESFWEEGSKAKMRPTREFNLSVHKLPHPKPYVYVDVNIGIGKN
jgi:hypothetical protein